MVCQGGDAVKNYLQPYAQPYYDQYISKHVEQAKPYVNTANEKYITPASNYAVSQFDVYGRPKYDQAKKTALKEYNRVAAPKVVQLTNEGQKYYNTYLVKHVDTAQKVYEQHRPTVINAVGQAATKAYPLYIAALPYAETAWERFVQLAGKAGVEGKGWVAQRWGMHVEPQLWRIQEKLGKKSSEINK